MDHLQTLPTPKLREALARAEKELGKGCELSLLIAAELERRRWRLSKLLDRQDAVYLLGTGLVAAGATKALNPGCGMIAAGVMLVSPLMLSAVVSGLIMIFSSTGKKP